jgi:hypothetical protein
MLSCFGVGGGEVRDVCIKSICQKVSIVKLVLVTHVAHIG